MKKVLLLAFVLGAFAAEVKTDANTTELSTTNEVAFGAPAIINMANPDAKNLADSCQDNCQRSCISSCGDDSECQENCTEDCMEGCTAGDECRARGCRP